MAADRRSFPERGQQMRVDRKRDQARREVLTALDEAALAKVKGGLKSERVQGDDPTGSGGG
jgi:hypothetical protein